MNLKILYLVVILVLTSCALKKNVIYFNNSESINLEKVNSLPVLRNDDFLSITVLGGDENTLKLVNSPLIQNGANKGYTSGAPSSFGYLIDQKGEINFPMLGKVKLAGLSRDQAIDTLELRLLSFIKNPVVSLQIQNFHVTILGEVKNPGTYTIPNEKINILQLIGLAGDLTVYGLRKNVMLIREENGKSKEYRIDLTKTEFLTSSILNLQQNDIVYIEPNQSKINSSRVSASASIFVSIATLIITTINSFK